MAVTASAGWRLKMPAPLNGTLETLAAPPLPWHSRVGPAVCIPNHGYWCFSIFPKLFSRFSVTLIWFPVCEMFSVQQKTELKYHFTDRVKSAVLQQHLILPPSCIHLPWLKSILEQHIRLITIQCANCHRQARTIRFWK